MECLSGEELDDEVLEELEEEEELRVLRLFFFDFDFFLDLEGEGDEDEEEEDCVLCFFFFDFECFLDLIDDELRVRFRPLSFCESCLSMPYAYKCNRRLTTSLAYNIRSQKIL